MKPLILYWNELCIPDDFSLDDANSVGPWATRAQCAFEALNETFKLQPQARVSVARGELQAEFGGRSLHTWLECWLGKERLRRLKGRIIQPLEQKEEALTSLDVELQLDGKAADGLTRAHISSSWVWSFGSPMTSSDGSNIKATLISIHISESTEVSIRNLASRQHVIDWAEQLACWGHEVSSSCVIHKFDSFQVIMYPLDHGYPHIHVCLNDEPHRSIKYRVDQFQELTNNGIEWLDTFLRKWIEIHSISLLESWRQCQRGKHPLKVSDEARR